MRWLFFINHPARALKDSFVNGGLIMKLAKDDDVKMSFTQQVRNQVGAFFPPQTKVEQKNIRLFFPCRMRGIGPIGCFADNLHAG